MEKTMLRGTGGQMA